MNKTLMILAGVLIIFGMTTMALAGGDKVRGERGQGAVIQVDFDSQGNQS